MKKFKKDDIVQVAIPFKVFRVFKDGYDVCNSSGDCLRVHENQINFYPQNQSIKMKAMQQAVLDTAKYLLKANNTVTTLEIKTELIRDYPYYFWTQTVVSKYMDQFYGDGIFTYTDNGTFRTYSYPVVATSGSAVSVGTKVTGTIANKAISTGKVTVVPKGLIPKSNTIKVSGFNSYVTGNSKFIDSVTLKDGRTIDKNEIRRQKKSVYAYVSRINPSKIHSVTVAGKSMLVK